MYLAEKATKLLPSEPATRYQVIQWLMFQMGGVGPMFGQANHFFRRAAEVAYGVDRYSKETRRLYSVLDKRLGEVKFLVDDYSIADIATYPWVDRFDWHKVDLEEFPNVHRWFKAVRSRPAVQRGMKIP
jgi:GST-like protein